MADSVQDIVQSATESAEAFAVVLQNEEQAGHAARFRTIAGYLREGSVQAALSEYERSAYSGPGGLNDIYAIDQARFDAAWSQCATKLRALKRANAG
jgi:hypothetical protein